jgi:hypothetical protein
MLGAWGLGHGANYLIPLFISIYFPLFQSISPYLPHSAILTKYNPSLVVLRLVTLIKSPMPGTSKKADYFFSPTFKITKNS